MLLMAPGPIAVDERVMTAALRPAITPEHRLFMEVLEDVFQKLRTSFRTDSWVTVLPGSGRIGLESAITSVIEPGDAVVQLVSGGFGELAVELAKRAGAEVTVIEGRWGGPIDLDALEEAVKRVHPKLVTVVHSETSTGTLYDPYPVGRIAHANGALYLVDAISSYANLPFEMDAMEVDLAVAASNKGIGSLHGLNMVGVSPRAIAAMDARKTVCSSYSYDLKRWNDAYFANSGIRRSATPPPTHLVYALQEACRQLMDEGLENRWARCERFASATRHAVQAAGLQLFPDEPLCANCVTAIRVPEGLQGPDILRLMEADGVLVAGTVARPSPISGRLVRISHQGIQASKAMLIPTLAALERALVELGFGIERGKTVAAFEACLKP